jgi:pimeloyl-ACP methyl ester carboxylesterase
VAGVLRRATVLLLVVSATTGALTACSGDDDSPATEKATTTAKTNAVAPERAIEWRDCGDDVECGGLVVPLDYTKPSGDTITLALERRHARKERVGALLVNPGGPGASGFPLVDDASGYFGDPLLDHFDIVSWDPRGVGKSSPIECLGNLDFFFSVDHSPDNAAEVDANERASKRIADACKQHSAKILPFLSSKSTVRDMDRIRAALGESKLTYLGFSYGTYLGALYADTFPTKVRAMVLDGALDPSVDFVHAALDQSNGFDSALDAFFAHCQKTGCKFGGDDPRGAYERLEAQVDQETVPGKVGGERRELGPGELDLGVATALYSGEAGWDVLADALRDLAKGDSSLMLSLSDSYTDRKPGGKYDNSFEAFLGIGCLDSPAPPLDQLPAVADEIAKAAPYFGASTVWLSGPCSAWPVPADGTPAPIHAKGAPPIVVIGTSNDPATPLKWAQALASQLESGRLVVYEGEGHTAYANGDKCVDDVVHSYLIDKKLPAVGKRC